VRTLPQQVPAQDARADDPMIGSPLARLVPGRARMRGPVPVDVITFRAPCPVCGQDCSWTQERDDTRVRSTQACSCTGV